MKTVVITAVFYGTVFGKSVRVITAMLHRQ